MDTLCKLDLRDLQSQMEGKMFSNLFKEIFRAAALLISASLAISGCTIKMYEGPDRDPSQLAIVYLIAGNDRLSVGYLNDTFVKRKTNRARIHMLPGNNKLTLAHVNSSYTNDGRRIRYVTYLYAISMDFKAGYSYIAWSGSDHSQSLELEQPPQEACIYEFTHADFEKLFDGNPHSITSPNGGNKVGCGNMINAKEYKQKHG